MKRFLAALAGMAILVAAWNYFSVVRPVTSAVREDSRNASISLSAHYRYYVFPRELNLRLNASEDAAAVDVWRSFFAAAEAMHKRGKRFSSVRMNRGRETIYVLDGADFKDIGREVSFGQNPIYLLRTIPPMLRRPDGGRPFGLSSGGLFGMASEIGNSTEAAATWARGGE